MIQKEQSVKVPLYFGELVMISVDCLTDLNSKHKIDAKSTWDSFCFKKEYKSGKIKYFIVLKKDNISFSVIAHEVVHLVNYIFIQAGIQLDLYNDEGQAYLTGWVFEQIENFTKEK